jgi:hypothetical protein
MKSKGGNLTGNLFKCWRMLTTEQMLPIYDEGVNKVLRKV